MDGVNASQLLTYDEITNVLGQFGFRRTDLPDVVVFDRQDYDALVALPPPHVADFVDPADMIQVRNAVVGKGVATAEALGEAIRQVKPAALAERSNTTPTRKRKRGIMPKTVSKAA